MARGSPQLINSVTAECIFLSPLQQLNTNFTIEKRGVGATSNSTRSQPLLPSETCPRCVQSSSRTWRSQDQSCRRRQRSWLHFTAIPQRSQHLSHTTSARKVRAGRKKQWYWAGSAFSADAAALLHLFSPRKKACLVQHHFRTLPAHEFSRWWVPRLYSPEGVCYWPFLLLSRIILGFWSIRTLAKYTCKIWIGGQPFNTPRLLVVCSYTSICRAKQLIPACTWR